MKSPLGATVHALSGNGLASQRERLDVVRGPRTGMYIVYDRAPPESQDRVSFIFHVQVVRVVRDGFARHRLPDALN